MLRFTLSRLVFCSCSAHVALGGAGTGGSRIGAGPTRPSAVDAARGPIGGPIARRGRRERGREIFEISIYYVSESA